jgi:acetyl esterase/lipase
VKDRAWSSIVKPAIYALPAPRSARGEPGPACLLIPGGGYERIVIDKEGYDIAAWLHSLGFGAFILKHRLPAEGHAAGADAPLLDAQRAMRFIRSRAGDFGVDPHRLGVMGFSAGGHLAAELSTRFADGLAPPLDHVDGLPARPDFSVLVYPVISMDTRISHPGSRERMLAGAGDRATLAREAEFAALHSCELNVRPDTPPAFLVHAADDPAVPCENSLRYVEALRKAGVPAELHLFRSGGHGFGIRSAAGPAALWTELCREWMDGAAASLGG